MKYDYLIVGAGFSGCTLAERLANEAGKKVLVVEKRNHIGGNCYDYYDEDGILVKPYGPHIFHTKLKHVWEYLNRFTVFNGYVHRVLSVVKGMELYFPINLETMEKLTGQSFTEESLKKYFREKRLEVGSVENSRDVVLSQVGEEVYELFVKYYTKKQWGVYPEELDAQVLRRIPVRYNRDTRYFDDPYQGIPVSGYHRIFDRMLVSPNIHVMLQVDCRDILDMVKFDRMVYTGPVDAYFDNVYGKLPYRSMRFDFETKDVELFQATAVVNYPMDNEYTRITEFKHFYMQEHRKTVICYEYPQAEGEPYYPIPMAANRELYAKYKVLVDKLKTVYFVGRLAEYQYLNMDLAVNHALELYKKLATDYTDGHG